MPHVFNPCSPVNVNDVYQEGKTLNDVLEERLFRALGECQDGYRFPGSRPEEHGRAHALPYLQPPRQLMKLSSRQREFLGRLLDLYREAMHSVHYTDVAQALDVSPVTAYEMMRLLEEKGMVRSEMVRPDGHRGRSMVAFSPTQKAMALLAQRDNGAMRQPEWEEAEAVILEALERGKGTDYQELLNELLGRIPRRESPQLFAADMVTTIILLLYGLQNTAPIVQIVSDLQWFGPPEWGSLYLLAGLGLALSLVENARCRGASSLSSHSRRFYECLDSLTGLDKKRLSDLAREVMQAVGLWKQGEGSVRDVASRTRSA